MTRNNTNEKLEMLIEKTKADAEYAHRAYLESVNALVNDTDAEDVEYFGRKVLEYGRAYKSLMDRLRTYEWMKGDEADGNN